MQLNLPKYSADIIKKEDGQLQIYDRLRKKYVALTPEEWVRQHFVNFLIEHRQYPASFMANEVGLEYNGCQRRCDTIVYDRTAHPAAIIEYKAPEVEINAKVFDQIVRYNMVLHVRTLMVSNGMRHFCCFCNAEQGTYEFQKDLPAWQDLF